MDKEEFSLFRISTNKKVPPPRGEGVPPGGEAVTPCNFCGNKYLFDYMHKKCKNCGNKIINKKANSMPTESSGFHIFKNKKAKKEKQTLHDDGVVIAKENVNKEKEKYIDSQDNCNCIII
jgi:hypothetical protein